MIYRMRTEGIEMSEFEKELRYMLTDKEIALLERVLKASKHRDGSIASLVGSHLRRLEENGTMDYLYPEAE